MSPCRALAAAGCLAWIGAACAGAPDPDAAPLVEVSGGGYAMGTVLEMTLLGRDAAALDAARLRAFDEVERLEKLVSLWEPESDTRRLNEAAGLGEISVHPDTAELLRRSLELSRTTLGAFDVTVGPLIELWRRAEERGAVPGEGERTAALARVGPEHLRLGEGGRVSLARGSAVDFGAVAKGHALDRALEVVGPAVEAALLNFGQSSTWAIGRPPGSAGWRLLVQAPGGGYAGVITLSDRALSASGSLGQWREIGGERYGHVIDPRSGDPLVQRRQALVVARDATLAEALATAVLVLGPDEGIEIAQSLAEVEALLLDADGRSWRTRGWNRVTRYRPLGAGARSGR